MFLSFLKNLFMLSIQKLKYLMISAKVTCYSVTSKLLATKNGRMDKKRRKCMKISVSCTFFLFLFYLVGKAFAPPPSVMVYIMPG